MLNWQINKKNLLLLFSLCIISVGLLNAKKTDENIVLADKVQESETLDKAQVKEIYDIEDYFEFADLVARGNTFENLEVMLCANLDFSGYQELRPIGDLGTDAEPAVFAGIFNGNGYAISNLQMKSFDGNAGMFAYLGGVVKNLQIENCVFEGKKAGAIAVKTEEAEIYNCKIDAVVSGEQIGTGVTELSGIMMNCIMPEGDVYDSLLDGGVYSCFYGEESEAVKLNQNLLVVSRMFGDTKLCLWENAENGVNVTPQYVELIESVTASIWAGGTELQLAGYYAPNFGKWCVALPAGYKNKEISLKVQTMSGEDLVLNKAKDAQEVVVRIGAIDYPIQFLGADNIDTLYVSLSKEEGLEYVHENKYSEVPGILTVLKMDGTTEFAVLQGFYGHGNDSWNEAKKSYNLKFDSYVNLLDMGANEDFALLAGYRRNSLMCYVASTELVKEMNFDYEPEYRLVNVYVNGEYVGVYFLAEKIKLDRNRIEISNLYEKTQQVNDEQLESFDYENQMSNGYAQWHYYKVDDNPEDITGGYLLEIDNEDYGQYDSRFVTNREIGVVLKRARHSSREQVEYISKFWQEFENALYSETGFNELGKHYSEYIDLQSFGMQWLMYELEQELSLNSSVYYYKESDVDGDGLLHACYPWDMEHAFAITKENEYLWLLDKNKDALNGFWAAFYQHEDFRKEVSRLWTENFVPAIEKLLIGEPIETESGLKTLGWYMHYMGDMHNLENSRWATQYPWNKLTEIETFLNVRLETLTNAFTGEKYAEN